MNTPLEGEQSSHEWPLLLEVCVCVMLGWSSLHSRWLLCAGLEPPRLWRQYGEHRWLNQLHLTITEQQLHSRKITREGSC